SGAVTRRPPDGSARRQPPRPLPRVYGLVEASIGAWALLSPVLFRLVGSVSVHSPAAAGGAGFAIDVALAALLLVPPTILMGGTIPILTQALSRDLRDATRFHAYV